MDGLNLITDEKGNNKALLLDLIYFKKENIKAEEVIKALSNLQDMIDQTTIVKSKTNSWDSAKEQLNKLKP